MSDAGLLRKPCDPCSVVHTCVCVCCMVWSVCRGPVMCVVLFSTLPHRSVLLLARSTISCILPEIWKSTNDSFWGFYVGFPLIFILGCVAIFHMLMSFCASSILGMFFSVLCIKFKIKWCSWWTCDACDWDLDFYCWWLDVTLTGTCRDSRNI